MKEKFLALVKQIKDTGVADSLCNATTVKERQEIWDRFLTEKQQELGKEIAELDFGFNNLPIFEEGEKIENPIEVAIFMWVADLKDNSLFEEPEDLKNAISKLENGYAVDLAEAMEGEWSNEITFFDPGDACMRERFLLIVERIKATGVVNALCNATTVEERQEILDKFPKEEKELCGEISYWIDKFRGDPIFEKGEFIENPLEVAFFIKSCTFCESELMLDQIFSDWDDLQDALRNLKNEYATKIADTMESIELFCINFSDPKEDW